MSKPNTQSRVSGTKSAIKPVRYGLDFSIQGAPPTSDQQQVPKRGTEEATASGLATAIARIQEYRGRGWSVEDAVTTACGAANVEEVDDFQATVMIWPTRDA